MGPPPGFTRFTQNYDERASKAGRHFARGSKAPRPAPTAADQVFTEQFAACAHLRPNEAHHFEVRGAFGEATFTVDQLPMLEEAIKAFRAECAIDDQRSDDRVVPKRLPLAGNRWR